MERSRTNVAEAWSAFWAEHGPQSHCLSSSQELREKLDGHWRGFGLMLPLGTRVIDIGCGSGAVGRALLKAQLSLEVVGVDAAKVPPSNDSRLELLSETPMERLPFADASFGAAVSQYGYEYGDRNAAASEMARVLEPGAPFSFLVHHPDGPVINDLRRHLGALQGLCSGDVRSAFLSGNSGALVEALTALKREYRDPIFDWAAPGLSGNIRRSQRGRAEVWRAVEQAIAPELIMLEAFDLLQPESPRQIADFTGPLEQHFRMNPPVTLETVGGKPFAWVISGNKAH